VLDAKPNRQNSRVWSNSFEASIESVGRVEFEPHPQKVMVWAGISAQGRTRLIFFEQGETVTQAVYEKKVLRGEVLRAGREIFGQSSWIYMQDGASAHTAKATRTWCATNLPDFLEPHEWPPRSPDLNPCDFFLWGTLEATVNDEPLRDLAHLKKKIQKAWRELPQETVARACRNILKRLKLCIKCGGSRFESCVL